jgi:arsenite oxidase small subunit
MPENEDSGAPPTDAKDETEENSRRNFLKIGLTLGLVLAGLGIASVLRSIISPSEALPAQVIPTKTQTQIATVTVTSTVGTPTGSMSGTGSTTSEFSTTSTTSSGPFPTIKVGNISDLTGGKTVTFNYPLEETPNLLVKLGEKAQNGVGPNGDIVAFSQICQHLGCIYGFVAAGASPGCDNTYKASGPVGYCCCHGSAYDLANGAKVLGGPAPRPVPQVILSYDDSTGDIYATGMSPPTIFGYHTGSDNVLYDLQGGTLVS